jgi:hypothetical protein
MDRRTMVITAAAVGAVVLAGGTAVAANVGILNSTSGDSIGKLTAVAPTTTPSSPDPTSATPAIPTVPSPTTTMQSTAAAVGQQYKVADAALVTVERTDLGIKLGNVTAQPGWTHDDEQISPTKLTVTLHSADVTYVFTAELAADGTIAAGLDQPVDQTPSAPVGPSGPSNSASTGSAKAGKPASSTHVDDDSGGSTSGSGHSSSDGDHTGREGGQDDD